MKISLVGPLLVGAAFAAQPNIIFFLTDDQDVEMGSLSYMPTVQRLLMDTGATFTRMYAHVPVCCPSRSALISGQYMHNNHCRGNAIATNCSSPSWQQGPEKRSYVTHLAAAGYKTFFAGKYLNDYGSPAAGGVAHIPPGWGDWQGLVGNSAYYDYTLSNNGVAEAHGADYAIDYLPNVILNKSLAFLTANLGTAPVFAVLSTPSCHGPQDAAPQYQDTFPGATAPRHPNYNATVAGTHWLESTHGGYAMDEDGAAFADLVFRRRVQTLQTVDDIVASVVDALEAAGQLDNTYLVYTADNGYHTGQYGLVYDKRNPFETDTHLPLVVRGPGVAAGTAVAAPVHMTDLSATFLDMAGVPVPAEFDSISILPLLRPSPPAPRVAAYIEYAGEGGGGGPRPICARTADDPTLMCNGPNNYSVPPYWFGGDFCMCQDSMNNTYSCIRVVAGANATEEKAQMLSRTGLPHAPPAATDMRYCEYQDGARTVEYFDYTSDPYELVNKAGVMPPALKAAFSARLAALNACKGAAECSPLLTQPIV